jgi:glycosyltransferase involved in cell wall biosynthesis
MRILAIFDKSAPKYHRILLPVHGLQQSYGWEVVVKYDFKEDDLKDIDILFFNRMIPTMALAYILLLRNKYGFKLVCDIDDHWLLNKDHVLKKGYDKHKISNVIADHIKAADLVTVTHERLAYECTSLNSNVHILPNAIPKHTQFLAKKEPDDLTRLFWAGGNTHRKDLELLRRPLQIIKRDKVKFIMGGYRHDDPELREMAKIFSTNSAYNTEVIEMLPVDKYYYAYSQCDISLIPLVDNEFNRHKSNLKILEAANVEAPVIVSKVHPYIGFPDNIVNYVTAANTWYSQINKLVNDPQLRKEQGIELRNYCDEHYNFNKINETRKQIFEYAVAQ